MKREKKKEKKKRNTRKRKKERKKRKEKEKGKKESNLEVSRAMLPVGSNDRPLIDPPVASMWDIHPCGSQAIPL